MPTTLQPFLHELVSCVAAPVMSLSSRDGQVRPGGVEGCYLGDRRLLSTCEVAVGGEVPTGVGDRPDGPAGAVFSSLLRRIGDPEPHDPTVHIVRERRLDRTSLRETVRVLSTARSSVGTELTIRLGSDLASMDAVKAGRRTVQLDAQTTEAGLAWTDGTRSVAVTCDPPPDRVDPATGTLGWDVELGPRASWEVRLHVEQSTGPAPQFPGIAVASWPRLTVASPDHRLEALVARSLDDLSALTLLDPESGGVFLGAGSPWYLTLYGRDSLWAARMLLPLDPSLAMSTLRTLAARQGRADVPETEEQPGKILHEVRAASFDLGTLRLPPLYYGTVDATALFVVTLASAWRWGSAPAEVQALLPAVRGCLEWIARAGTDRFITYRDQTGHGLANQGWKDSPDGIQWADGRLAEPPVALCEVQAYAHQAAVLGADLLDAFGDDGTRWREWAADMRDRFRDAFWVEDDHGRYPAVALDGQGRPVDSVTSNLGHLLGTGLLDRDEAALVAERLASPDLDSGFGLRTLSAASGGYAPLTYHAGSVWPHDTAIAVGGLARDGFAPAAMALLQGLIRAAPTFDYRLPELYSGAADDRPAAYPASCRPQAWSAAGVVHALTAVLGIEADVPAGVVRVAEQVSLPWAPLTVSGLRVGSAALDISVAADGSVHARCDDPALTVVQHP